MRVSSKRDPYFLVAAVLALSALVFSARVVPHGEPWSTNFDLYRTPVDGSAAPVDLTASNPAADTPAAALLASILSSPQRFRATLFRHGLQAPRELPIETVR